MLAVLRIWRKKQEQLNCGYLRVKANMLATSIVIAKFLLQMHNKKTFDLEHEGQGDGAQHPQ